MLAFIRNLRAALRRLLRSPLFTLVAIITLALGIGANSAVFSIVDGVLLKSLPFKDPERLVSIWYKAPGIGPGEFNQGPAFHPSDRADCRHHFCRTLLIDYHGQPNQ